MSNQQSLSDIVREFNATPAAQTIAKTFPGTTIVLTDEQYAELAQDLLIALRQLVILQKGKNVKRNTLWKQMIEVVIEGLKAAERLKEIPLDNRV